ncbi:MAG TPA: hypothetical protein VFU84_13330 [Gaiellaceae bacterium]|nr:hypothetical protein [Gaiellaceae bacterium]
MPAEREWPDPDIPQDPGIPGSKTPEQVPPDDAPEVAEVPDAEQPDADDEGHQAPPEP